jgi:NitT/TauT family transport system ATP-binding protein
MRAAWLLEPLFHMTTRVFLESLEIGKVSMCHNIGLPEPSVTSTGRKIVLDVMNVSHAYSSSDGRRVTALEDVSVQVLQGEFIAIVGPSGCGKTTLLNLIAGLLTPSAGRVEIEGKPVQNAINRRQIGLVFQDPALLSWRDLAANVRLPLEITGHSKEMGRVNDLIQLVGLEGFERNYPRELSGGMRSRASIARALVTSPAILLMDEPLGSLDEMTAQAINLKLLLIWSKLSPTVLLVTHNISQAVFVADRVLVLSHRPGRIVKSVRVGLPRPRTEELREEETFHQVCREIRHELRSQSTRVDTL